MKDSPRQLSRSLYCALTTASRVFTQPGSKADVDCLSSNIRFVPEGDIGAEQFKCPWLSIIIQYSTDYWIWLACNGESPKLLQIGACTVMLYAEQFKRISTIVLDANPDAAGFGALREQLVDLLINVGAAGGRDRRWRLVPPRSKQACQPRSFRQAVRENLPVARPARSPVVHRRASQRACCGCASQMARAIACRGIAKRQDHSRRFDCLSFHCTAKELRDVARERSKYHASFVLRKQPKKNRLDTLIEQLAEIYSDITHYPCHHSCLPHSANSYFAQFCRTILKPFFTTREVSLGAISKRWKRLKDDASRRPGRKKKPQERCSKDCNKRKRRTLRPPY